MSPAPLTSTGQDGPLPHPEGEMSAANRVFGIAELLEMILICASDNQPGWGKHVGTRDPVKILFTVQRVSKVFQAGVINCKLLQRRMFLLPYPRQASRPDEYLHRTRSGIRAIRELLPSLCAPVLWLQRCMEVSSSHELSLGWVKGVGHPVPSPRDVLHLALFPASPKAPQKHTAAWLAPEASWRKMEVYGTEDWALVELTCRTIVNNRYFSWKSEKQSPVTLGQLHQWFEQIIRFEAQIEKMQKRRFAPWYKRILRRGLRHEFTREGIANLIEELGLEEWS